MKSIKNCENLNQKKVLLRVDFNCPIMDGKIMDTSRIDLVFDGLKSIFSIIEVIMIFFLVKNRNNNTFLDYCKEKISKNIYLYQVNDG